MEYARSVADAILDRSPEELVGALLIATVVAIAMMGLHALGRRRWPRSSSFVGGLALAAGVLCMALAAGYLEFAGAIEGRGRGGFPPTFSGTAPAGPARNQPPSPSGFWGAAWSSGLHIVVAADEGHDGRLTPEEAARLIREADTDGDGSVDFRDIDRLIMGRFRPPDKPAGLAPLGEPDRQEGERPPGGRAAFDEGSTRVE